MRPSSARAPWPGGRRDRSHASPSRGRAVTERHEEPSGEGAGERERELVEFLPLAYEELRGLAANLLRGRRRASPAHDVAGTRGLAAPRAARRPRRARAGRTSWPSRRARCGTCWWTTRAGRAPSSAAAMPERVPLIDGLSRAHPDPDVLAVDEALTRLSRLDPRKGRVVELRFFGGLDVAEIGRGPGGLRRDGQARLGAGEGLAAPRDQCGRPARSVARPMTDRRAADEHGAGSASRTCSGGLRRRAGRARRLAGPPLPGRPGAASRRVFAAGRVGAGAVLPRDAGLRPLAQRADDVAAGPVAPGGAARHGGMGIVTKRCTSRRSSARRQGAADGCAR